MVVIDSCMNEWVYASFENDECITMAGALAYVPMSTIAILCH